MNCPKCSTVLRIFTGISFGSSLVRTTGGADLIHGQTCWKCGCWVEIEDSAPVEVEEELKHQRNKKNPRFTPGFMRDFVKKNLKKIKKMEADGRSFFFIANALGQPNSYNTIKKYYDQFTGC